MREQSTRWSQVDYRSQKTKASSLIVFEDSKGLQPKTYNVVHFEDKNQENLLL